MKVQHAAAVLQAKPADVWCCMSSFDSHLCFDCTMSSSMWPLGAALPFPFVVFAFRGVVCCVRYTQALFVFVFAPAEQ